MQDVVAPVSNITFDIEIALNSQLGSQPLPFPGMDSKYPCNCMFFGQVFSDRCSVLISNLLLENKGAAIHLPHDMYHHSCHDYCVFPYKFSGNIIVQYEGIEKCIIYSSELNGY